MEHTNKQTLLKEHAARRAAIGAAGLGSRCRRWRRRATARRWLLLTALLAVTVVLTDYAAVAHRTWALGALNAEQASSNISQMLLNR